MLGNIKRGIKKLGQKGKKKLVSLGLTISCFALAMPVFAEDGVALATTGNTDLDTIIETMTEGVGTMAKGGVLIVGTVIGFAITFIAARWLFGLFKQWSSKAN